MKTIEERDNLIRLLQEALKFYAEKENYKGNRNICCSGIAVSLVEIDEGSQARFALEKVNELDAANQKLQDDYNKIINETINTIENHPINLENLINSFKNSDND